MSHRRFLDIIMTMKKIVLITGFVALILLGISGCSSTNFSFRQTVEKYNRAVIEFYKTGSSADFKYVATPTEQRKISQTFANMKAEGKSMEAELNSISFKEITRSSKNIATVKTTENWSYRIFNQNEEPNGKYNKVTYEVTYNLTNIKEASKDKPDDDWLVDAVTITAEKKD